MLGSTGQASQTPGELKAPSADSAATPSACGRNDDEGDVAGRVDAHRASADSLRRPAIISAQDRLRVQRAEENR